MNNLKKLYSVTFKGRTLQIMANNAYDARSKGIEYFISHSYNDPTEIRQLIEVKSQIRNA